MALKIQTIAIPLSPPVESLAADIAIDMTPAPDSFAILDLKIASKLYPLKPETVATETITFPERPATFKIEVVASVPKKVAVSKVRFLPPVHVDTITVPTKFDNMKGRVHRILCKPPDSIKTIESNYMKHVPISREMLNKNLIPFPVLSDFMFELAKRNKTSYTNINFIGVFDPIPMHLAEKFTIDTVYGVLKFYIRKEPKGERRFSRIVYGRRRDNGEIVSAQFPVK